MSRVILTARARHASLILTFLLHTGIALAQDVVSLDSTLEREKFAKTHNVEFATADPSLPVKTAFDTINGRNTVNKELQPYIRFFRAEHGSYPPELIERSQLKLISTQP